MIEHGQFNSLQKSFVETFIGKFTIHAKLLILKGYFFSLLKKKLRDTNCQKSVVLKMSLLATMVSVSQTCGFVMETMIVKIILMKTVHLQKEIVVSIIIIIIIIGFFYYVTSKILKKCWENCLPCKCNFQAQSENVFV